MRERMDGMPTIVFQRLTDAGLGGGSQPIVDVIAGINQSTDTDQEIPSPIANHSVQRESNDPMEGWSKLKRQNAEGLARLGIKPENAGLTHKLNPRFTRVGL